MIDTDEDSLRRLVAKLVAQHFYADETAALDALRRRAMFNVVDDVTGWNTDFVILPRDEFARAQWERRQAASVLGVEVVAATAEDTVLAKMVWARRGGGISRLRGPSLPASLVRSGALDPPNWIRSRVPWRFVPRRQGRSGHRVSPAVGPDSSLSM